MDGREILGGNRPELYRDFPDSSFPNASSSFSLLFGLHSSSPPIATGTLAALSREWRLLTMGVIRVLLALFPLMAFSSVPIHNSLRVWNSQRLPLRLKYRNDIVFQAPQVLWFVVMSQTRSSGKQGLVCNNKPLVIASYCSTSYATW
jgi:hypothetical protein